jgi:hypothetical protein
MSGTLPTSPAPSSAILRSITQTFVSVSHNFKRQARSRGAQRWGVTISWPPMKRPAADGIIAFLLAQRGQLEEWTLQPIPDKGTPRGVGGGSPTVDGAQTAGDTTILLQSAPLSTTQWLAAGDLVRFAGHAKVYMLTADASTDGAGAVTISITPPIITSLADLEAVTITNVPMTVALGSDSLEMSLTPGVLYNLTVELVEVA